MAEDRGAGTCQQNHPGSYGYPLRPDGPYPFCSRSGKPMVWACPSCGAPLPEESSELLLAHFCRACGTRYFPDAAQRPAGAHGPANNVALCCRIDTCQRAPFTAAHL